MQLAIDPQAVLESVFGYTTFRPGQREIIDALRAGRDCIGVMPTGAGKSLTFQIPAKLLGGTVLVESVNGVGPYHIKGIGESPLTPVAPAIANQLQKVCRLLCHT